MRILVTGGAGFVGSNLAVQLHRALPDSDIVCMDNLYRRGSELNVPRLRGEGVGFQWGDVRDPASFPAGPFDLILECSAEPSVLAGTDGGMEYLYHTNLTGLLHCLEKARAWRSRLLFLSTSRVYPIRPLLAHPWREDATRFAWLDNGTPGLGAQGVGEELDMRGARSPYGFTKYAAELLIEEYRAAYGLKAVVNRCGVLAGPWQFGRVDQGVVALWVMAHHFGKPLAYIGFGGAGKQVRDYLHVDDLGELVLEQVRNFDAWDGWCGNVAGGLENSVSLCELTEVCRRVTGREVPVRSVPETRPHDLRLFFADCRRLCARTGWRPRRDIRAVAADIGEWVRAHEQELRMLLN